MFICAGESEQFDFAMPVGIGLIDVAINLTRLILSEKPEKLFFVGTAGSYGSAEIFDIVTSCRAANIENSYFNAGAYTPIVSRETSLYDDTLCKDEVVVNSSNYITTQSDLGQFYLKEGIAIENMEFYAVLKVANRFNIPAVGVFVVTNYCNASAHQDFLNNQKEAMAKLTEYAKKRVKI